VLISADFSQVQLLKSNWGDGFSTALTVFLPKLRYAGISDAVIHRMTVDNPRRFLAFVPKSGHG
jgi:predicted metal-dependent phosphotriesterase family hydrolase